MYYMYYMFTDPLCRNDDNDITKLQKTCIYMMALLPA